MEVATELFIRHGYAGVSLAEIARGAGVVRLTVLQHCGDKHTIFRDVISATYTGTRLPQPNPEPGDGVRAALLDAARYVFDHALQQKSIDLSRMMIAESRRFPELMRQVENAILVRYQAYICAILGGLKKSDLLPDGDHTRSAKLFIDLILSRLAFMSYIDCDILRPTDSDLAERVDLFISGRWSTIEIEQASDAVNTDETIG